MRVRTLPSDRRSSTVNPANVSSTPPTNVNSDVSRVCATGDTASPAIAPSASPNAASPNAMATLPARSGTDEAASRGVRGVASGINRPRRRIRRAPIEIQNRRDAPGW